MENASLALKIAGGLLIAVIILSLVTWGFKQFGMLPEQQDASMTAEQLAKFNQEFEVYNKKKMYGVDVISCLNKVYNYNEKYVLEVGQGEDGSGIGKLSSSDGFYTGTSKHGKEFLINAYVHIDSPLKERIEGFRIDEKTGKEVRIFGKGIVSDKQLGEVWNQKEDEQLFLSDTSKDKAYTSFKADTRLCDIDCGGEITLDNQPYYMKGKKENGGEPLDVFSTEDSTHYYKLYGGGGVDTNPLYKLLRYSDKNMKKTATNSESDGVTDWSKIIWYTALYDFKTRTFECTHMDIDGESGRIKHIAFSEVNKK